MPPMTTTDLPRRPTLRELLQIPSANGSSDGAVVPWAERLEPEVVTALDRLDAAVAADPLVGDADLVSRAFAKAYKAHEGCRRKSGEPYIIHPIAVTTTLAKMQLDPETLAGGLLHDVIEDAGVSIDDIAGEFGPRVAKLVDGVTKLGKIPWSGDTKELASREK